MERSEIKRLLELPLTDLIARANRVRQDAAPDTLHLCNILNAKSGLCAEDCKFCAQSARHATGVATYSLMSKAGMVAAAKEARNMGAHHFGIVTSGNALTRQDLHVIAEAMAEIRDTVGIANCASLGKLDDESFKLLKRSGLTRYHHNIETSANFYTKIVTTHSFQERLDTIKAAKRAGLQVCSGGIIGMGETWDDRIDMAFILKESGVDSVPINILVPVKGTKLENIMPITSSDAIRTIALFRIILKDTIIKIAAGRESVLKEFLAMAFMAGANGMLIGGYLTVRGRAVEDDKRLVREVEEAWRI
jgi:biotin synthase